MIYQIQLWLNPKLITRGVERKSSFNNKNSKIKVNHTLPKINNVMTKIDNKGINIKRKDTGPAFTREPKKKISCEFEVEPSIKVLIDKYDNKDGTNEVKDDTNDVKDVTNDVKDDTNDVKDDTNDNKDVANDVKDGTSDIKEDTKISKTDKDTQTDLIQDEPELNNKGQIPEESQSMDDNDNPDENPYKHLITAQLIHPIIHQSLRRSWNQVMMILQVLQISPLVRNYQ